MNNEDKILEMLGGLTETVGALTETVSNIQAELKETRVELKADIKENSNDIGKLGATIESEISDKIRGLYDNREIVNSKLDSIDDKMDEIQVDINNISIKTLQNDNQLIKLVKNQK